MVDEPQRVGVRDGGLQNLIVATYIGLDVRPKGVVGNLSGRFFYSQYVHNIYDIDPVHKGEFGSRGTFWRSSGRYRQKSTLKIGLVI